MRTMDAAVVLEDYQAADTAVVVVATKAALSVMVAVHVAVGIMIGTTRSSDTMTGTAGAEAMVEEVPAGMCMHNHAGMLCCRNSSELRAHRFTSSHWTAYQHMA